jgi:hypothetical protein
MSGNSELISTVCPQCKHANVARGRSNTLAMTCAACGVYFTTGKWSKEIIKFNIEANPVFPIGTQARIKGIKYEVMGFVVKNVRKYGYSWREYTLYHPIHGILFLSESSGNWNIVRPINDNPRGGIKGVEFTYEEHFYRLYQRYKADIVYAKGEFVSDIFNITDESQCDEYISPPYLLSFESDKSGSRWYKGEYVSPEDIIAYFKPGLYKLPKKEGRGYTQPFVSSFKPESLAALCAVLGVLVLFLQLYFGNTAKEKIVLDQTFNRKDATDQTLFVSDSFRVEGAMKSLVVIVRSPIDNDWFFGDFVLVNQDDDTEYEFSKEIEYYHGYSDGESWVEGSNQGEAYLSRIPEGNYRINIYPEFSQSGSFDIQVIRDEASVTNMWVTLALLAIFPTYYFFRRHNIESTRWSDSDYSPYTEE